MTKESDEFEQEITRIHELIESQSAEVRWNEKVVDLDTGYLRQIDFTIRYGQRLTIGECRLRKRPAGVEWIEQLLQKKESVGADEIIAVSNSGFANTAQTKGEKRGVHLRDLKELTDNEILDWGKSVTLKFSYFEFVSLQFSLIFPETLSHLIPSPLTSKCLPLRQRVGTIEKVFTKNDIDFKKFEGEKIHVTGSVKNPKLRVNNVAISEIGLDGLGFCRRGEIPVSIVAAYDKPKVSALKRTVFIQSSSTGETEIIKSGNRASVVVDLSEIGMPPNSYLYTWELDMRELTRVKLTNPIGLESLFSKYGEMEFELTTSHC